MCIIERIDGALWRRGFIQPPVRRVMRNILCVSLALAAAGIVLLPFTDEGVWIALASLLTSWNFYDIARSVQKAMPASIQAGDSRGAAAAAIVKKRVLLRSQIRLFLSAVFLYAALVVFHASPFSLAAGFSVSVIVIPFSLLPRS